MKKDTSQKRVGYIAKEFDVLMRKHIRQSAERLRIKLRLAWKKNANLKVR